MKILVDKIPEFPKACLFVKYNCEYGYLCGFSKKLCPVIEKGCKYLDAKKEEVTEE